jgi:hypothetical protein
MMTLPVVVSVSRVNILNRKRICNARKVQIARFIKIDSIAIIHFEKYHHSPFFRLTP